MKCSEHPVQIREGGEALVSRFLDQAFKTEPYGFCVRRGMARLLYLCEQRFIDIEGFPSRIQFLRHPYASSPCTNTHAHHIEVVSWFFILDHVVNSSTFGEPCLTTVYLSVFQRLPQRLRTNRSNSGISTMKSTPS